MLAPPMADRSGNAAAVTDWQAPCESSDTDVCQRRTVAEAADPGPVAASPDDTQITLDKAPRTPRPFTQTC